MKCRMTETLADWAAATPCMQWYALSYSLPVITGDRHGRLFLGKCSCTSVVEKERERSILFNEEIFPYLTPRRWWQNGLWILSTSRVITDSGNPKDLETNLTSVTLSSPKPMRTKLAMNPCFRGSRPAIEGLSHGMAYSRVTKHFILTL